MQTGGTSRWFPDVAGGNKIAPGDQFYPEEVRLATRNRGMPLEALRYAVTPSGMHYLLVHFDVPYVDPSSWRLSVGGLVSEELVLGLDDLRSLPSRTLAVTMECAGNGRALMSPRPISQPWLYEAVGTARWTGTPLKGLLDRAGVSPRAVEIVFTGLDRGVQGDDVHHFQRSLTVAEAAGDDVLLAYEMNGEPLQPQHGFPLRLVVPGWYGMTDVKWLDRIEAVSKPFEGYQVSKTYRYARSADDPGDPVTTLRVKALMVPPGIPDFASRTRLLHPGPTVLEGRAWAGRIDVSRVEVSLDGGSTWADGDMDDQVETYAWRRWRFQWEAEIGARTLCVRATDSQGNTQPMREWSYQGMGNNMVQRVEVVVADDF